MRHELYNNIPVYLNLSADIYKKISTSDLIFKIFTMGFTFMKCISEFVAQCTA